jgi:hypothetical protein
MSSSNEKKIEGFKIGNYFCSFPTNRDFLQEDEDGRMYVLVDVYHLEHDDIMRKLEQEEITPEIEQMISEEINRILLDAVDRSEKEDINK